MSEQIIKGYTTPIANRALCISDHTGPKSYMQWTKPNTGGDVINGNVGGGLNAFGLRGIDIAIPVGISVSGTYYVEAKMIAGGAGAETEVILVWYLTATPGTQPDAATDLSGETIRLLVIGG